MIATIIACCYITFLCFTWGTACTRLLRKIDGERELHFSIVCLCGLALITVFASMLSLFIPLGTWQAQLIFLLPSLLIIRYIRIPRSSLHWSVLCLLVFAIIGILMMSSWWIVHPDTLGYHAQTIKWIEEFKAVPGLVHLHTRLGYQGLWFVAESLFSFRFTGSSAVSYINVAVLTWFVIFICDKVNDCIKNRNGFHGLLWLLLFVFTLWNYTQVRLTATSASPDFIATLYVLAIFYLLFQHPPSWLLLITLSVFVVVVKLSASPMMLITLYSIIQLLRSKFYKQAVFGVVIGLLILIPFVTRNLITSGWVVFPSTFPDIANVDWKFDASRTALEKKYITAYARTKSGESEAEILSSVNASYSEWVPVWWRNLSIADKTLIVISLLSMLFLIITIRRSIRTGESSWAAIVIVIVGVLFWFTQAPDPRFGAGFLMMLPALALTKIKIELSRNLIIAGTLAISIVCVAYTVYRVINFFEKEQLWMPLGIKPQQSTTIDCNGLEINVSPNGEPCNTAPLPCAATGCEHVEARGADIRYGFRGK